MRVPKTSKERSGGRTNPSASDGLANGGQDAGGITFEMNWRGKGRRRILDPRPREHEHDARAGVDLVRLLHDAEGSEGRRRLRSRPYPLHPSQERLRLDDGPLADGLRMTAGLAKDLEHLPSAERP